jgi:hypothetical protein
VVVGGVTLLFTTVSFLCPVFAVRTLGRWGAEVETEIDGESCHARERPT